MTLLWARPIVSSLALREAFPPLPSPLFLFLLCFHRTFLPFSVSRGAIEEQRYNSVHPRDVTIDRREVL